MIHKGTKTINTGRLILRAMTIDDADEILLGYRNQPEFLYYANKKPINNEDFLLELNNIIVHYQQQNYYNWVIVLKETNRIVGSINFKIMEDNESALVGYATDNRYTCHGYMTESLSAVINYALHQLKLKNLLGGCATNNIASRKVMEKCGMKYTHTVNNFLHLADGNYDMLMFKIEQ